MDNVFRLTEGFLDKYKGRQPNWGYGVVGWVTYKRTYARLKPDGNLEDWWETVKRVVEGCYNVQKLHCEAHRLPWNGNKGQLSAQKMYDLIFNMKFLPPGRGLWAMGTEYVSERGSAALNNCGFVSTKDIKRDFARPFCFLMDMSMLGVGVGADTKGAGTFTLTQPDYDDEPYIIPDSREGWVDSLKAILDAFSGRGRLPAKFDYSQIRPQGATLRGFGGKASGPGPLKLLHKDVIRMLHKQVYEKNGEVTSTVIVDIFNMAGRCVVAGGIRRSAEIMLGDSEDADFLDLKNPAKWKKELNSHRWASNNSVFAEVGMDYEPFVDQIMENGEPGFVWLDNARNYGRMIDGFNEDADPFVMGCNPCGEQSLESYELCNLVETFPAFHESYEEFQFTLKYAYLYAKTVSLIPTHDPNANAIIGRNRRIGTSVSGITQAIQRFGFRSFIQMLDKGYQYLRQLDNIYARWLCVPNSIKLTSVKPSGTISLLTGATPGIHFPESEYYIRNIRFDPGSPLLERLEAAGYPVEPSIQKDNTLVVSFPVRQELFSKSKYDVTVWEQFELASQIQKHWSDNQVSVTITVQEGEAQDVPRCLSMYESRLKSVSMLPLGEHGYKQAPYIPITKAEYDKMMRKLKPLDFNVSEKECHDQEDKFCDSESCEIKT